MLVPVPERSPEQPDTRTTARLHERRAAASPAKPHKGQGVMSAEFSASSGLFSLANPEWVDLQRQSRNTLRISQKDEEKKTTLQVCLRNKADIIQLGLFCNQTSVSCNSPLRPLPRIHTHTSSQNPNSRPHASHRHTYPALNLYGSASTLTVELDKVSGFPLLCLG